MVRHMEKIKRGCLNAKTALSEAVVAVTNPTRYAPESSQVVDRPNYMLAGHKAPHVYGYPDQDADVRVCATSTGMPRRIDRNNMLHYDEREYKPMTMEQKYRRL